MTYARLMANFKYSRHFVILLHFVEGSQTTVVCCAVWFSKPSAVFQQMQENVTCYFIAEWNQTFPIETEPNGTETVRVPAHL